MNQMTLAATGDSLITRRLALPNGDAQLLSALIGAADVRFTNLETVIRHDEGFPAAQSGGTWTSSPPEVLDDLHAYYGFNLVGWATNHTLDYSCGGLEATARHLRRRGLVHAGAGANLAEASLPQYLDTTAGRVALIALTATFHESWIAGEQRGDCPGRPGINPLRHQTVYRVSPARLAVLKETAAVSGINEYRNLMVKNGFQKPDPDNLFRFGQHLFGATSPGEAECETTTPDPRDMQRTFKAIDEARRQAALVVISLHAHDFKDGRNEAAAQYLGDFARACIDRGAHAVIGHGPHIVRGIEVYKRRPIFHSLGNFIFQSDTVARLPSDYYEKYGLGSEHTPADAFDIRSDGDRRGYAADPRIWRAILPVWRMEEGDLAELTLHPLALGFGQPRHASGWPSLTSDTTVIEEVQSLSKELGTRFEIADGQAHWRG